MRINFKDGSHKDLDIAQAVSMKLSNENDNRIYLEQLHNGSFRLMWTEGLIEEFSDVVNLEMIREGDRHIGAESIAEMIDKSILKDMTTKAIQDGSDGVTKLVVDKIIQMSESINANTRSGKGNYILVKENSETSKALFGGKLEIELMLREAFALGYAEGSYESSGDKTIYEDECHQYGSFQRLIKKYLGEEERSGIENETV